MSIPLTRIIALVALFAGTAAPTSSLRAQRDRARHVERRSPTAMTTDDPLTGAMSSYAELTRKTAAATR